MQVLTGLLGGKVCLKLAYLMLTWMVLFEYDTRGEILEIGYWYSWALAMVYIS